MSESATGNSAQRAVPAPELSFTLSMTGGDGRWRKHGDYALWTGTRKTDEPPYMLHELSAKGVVPIPHRQNRPILHRIAAGTPYHVTHLFGFWITHDVDAVWIEAPAKGASHYSLMVGGTSGTPNATTCSFVCPKCATAFGSESVTTGPNRFESFLDTALARVRAFNADPKQRICPKCGTVHPRTYGFYADTDQPAEKALRASGGIEGAA